LDVSGSDSGVRAHAPDRRPLRRDLLGSAERVLAGIDRLLMLKDDGSVLVHADAGGYKPLN
jgi:hypothetical protein